MRLSNHGSSQSRYWWTERTKPQYFVSDECQGSDSNCRSLYLWKPDARSPAIIIRFISQQRKTKQEGLKAIENKLKQFFGVKIEKEEPELDILGRQAVWSLLFLVSEHLHSHRNSTQKIPCFLRWNVEGMKSDRRYGKERTWHTGNKGSNHWKTDSVWFCEKGKKNLIPTDDGNVLITVLPDEIKSPSMTAEWKWYLITLPRIQRQQMNS